MRSRVATLLIAAACAVTTVPAIAHHSGAMFEEKKEVTLTGVVKEFQFTIRIRGSWWTSRDRTAK